MDNLRIDLEGFLKNPTRIWNIALILGDLKEYKQAEERLREAIEGYKRAIGGERRHILKSQYSLTPLSWAARNGYGIVVKLLLMKDSVDPDLKDNHMVGHHYRGQPEECMRPWSSYCSRQARSRSA